MTPKVNLKFYNIIIAQWKITILKLAPECFPETRFTSVWENILISSLKVEGKP